MVSFRKKNIAAFSRSGTVESRTTLRNRSWAVELRTVPSIRLERLQRPLTIFRLPNALVYGHTQASPVALTPVSPLPAGSFSVWANTPCPTICREESNLSSCAFTIASIPCGKEPESANGRITIAPYACVMLATLPETLLATPAVSHSGSC